MRAYYLLFGLFVLLSFCSKKKSEGSKNIVASDTTVVAYDTTFESKQTIIQKEVASFDLDSIRKKILESKASSSDTVKYKFSLEDVGTEGNEGTAFYLNNNLRKVELDIYTSMWKIHLLYLFKNTHIEVTERTYNTYENLKLVNNISYIIDFNGTPLEKGDHSKRVDLFQEIKSTVPFTLK